MSTPIHIIFALNTLRASKLTIFLAKLFGVKTVGYDSGCTITMHYWRGKYYLTDYKQDLP